MLNPGSSTLKFGLYRMPEGTVWAEGVVDHLGTPAGELRLTFPDGEHPPVQKALGELTPAQSVTAALQSLPARTPIDAIGCRVVHGGEQFASATRVTPEVIAAIRSLGALAPLHNPVAAEVLEACQKELPETPIVAVFDTAFHATLPPVARTYALPQDLAEREGLRRYGFHGIAHHAVSEAAREQHHSLGRPAARCINCHLGNGASVCAMRDGKSVDTSMGMTPLEGLVMGTRSGDVDPGLLLYLLQQEHYTPEMLDDLLNRKSGLLGLSGLSSDVRELTRASEAGDTRAELALEIFAYRVAKTIGAYTVVLEGLDILAFSGGIGEHSALMRARICRPLHFLGVELDAARNTAPEAVAGKDLALLSGDESTAAVWAVPANENRQIAREVWGSVPHPQSR